ncbi:MAG: PAS domain S-box protein [Pirellulales bacterium]
MIGITRRRGLFRYFGLAFILGGCLLVVSAWAKRRGIVSHLTEDSLQLISWCLFLAPMLIFARSSLGSPSIRRAALASFLVMLVWRWIDIADEVPVLDHIPLIGRHSRFQSGMQQAFTVLTGASLLYVVMLFYDELAAGTARERESNARFHNLFDNMPTVCFTFDRAGKILSWNRAAEDLYGYTAAEAVGASALSILVTPETLDATRHMIGEVFVGRSMSGTQWYDRDKNGQLGCRLRSAFPLLRDDGCVECGVSMSVDITDRRKAEADLAQSRHERELIADNVPALLAHIDSTLRYRFVNPRYSEWFGRTSQEIVGMHPRDLLGEAGYARALPHFDAVLCGVAQEYENEITRSDGRTNYTHVNLVPDHDDQGNVVGFYVMVKDVTQQKLAEHEAENERVLLRRLLDLQERERQTVTHDIHDGIVQYVVGAQMQVESCEATLDPLDQATAAKLSQASTHLREAVREGRRLISGLRPPIIDEAGLVAAIEHLIGDLSRHEGSRVEFEHNDIDRELPAFLETALFRIVQEALTNIARHSGSQNALVELHRTPATILLDISDDGRGFDREAVAPGRFGLRGIEERARLFGGQAKIDSAPGKGTRIHVEMPFDVNDRAAPWSAAAFATDNLAS